MNFKKNWARSFSKTERENEDCEIMAVISKANRCLSIMNPSAPKTKRSPVRLKRRSVDFTQERLKIPSLPRRSPLRTIQTFDNHKQVSKPFTLTLKPAWELEPSSPVSDSTASTKDGASTSRSTFSSRNM